MQNQTYTDIECILVDDKGQDDSMKVAKQFVEEYKGTVKFLLCEHHVIRACQQQGILALIKLQAIIFFLR